MRLRYYTGPWICRTEAIKRIHTIGEGSMILPEIPLRLIYDGLSYVEVGLQPQSRTAGVTKTFRFTNVVFVVTSIARLFWSVRATGSRSRVKGVNADEHG